MRFLVSEGPTSIRCVNRGQRPNDKKYERPTLVRAPHEKTPTDRVLQLQEGECPLVMAWRALTTTLQHHRVAQLERQPRNQANQTAPGSTRPPYHQKEGVGVIPRGLGYKYTKDDPLPKKKEKQIFSPRYSSRKTENTILLQRNDTGILNQSFTSGVAAVPLPPSSDEQYKKPTIDHACVTRGKDTSSDYGNKTQ